MKVSIPYYRKPYIPKNGSQDAIEAHNVTIKGEKDEVLEILKNLGIDSGEDCARATN